jgi:primosomal protein N' (replication factor Y)
VERIAEEAAARWPDARRLVMSSDVQGGPEAIRRQFRAIADGAVDVVIGTQLVAKGFTFPALALVGVVDADIGLHGTDPRAAERTFQLLVQVTGRAGRTGETPGRGLLQTHDPDHPVIAALVAGDREAFYRAEIEVRRRHGLPPFVRLAAIVVSATEREQALADARTLARLAPREGPAEILGPAEAPLAVLRGRHRFRLLVRAPRTFDLQGMLRAWLAAAGPERGSVRRTVDVDPQSFL